MLTLLLTDPRVNPNEVIKTYKHQHYNLDLLQLVVNDEKTTITQEEIIATANHFSFEVFKVITSKTFKKEEMQIMFETLKKNNI